MKPSSKLCSTNQKGKEAEGQALEWVIHRGGKLIAKNFFCKGAELDLIVEWGRDYPSHLIELAFIEVKWRAEVHWIRGIDAIDWNKRRKIEKAARVFLSQYRGSAQMISFNALIKEGDKEWSYFPNLWSLNE